jgi:hypothetical protein
MRTPRRIWAAGDVTPLPVHADRPVQARIAIDDMFGRDGLLRTTPATHRDLHRAELQVSG